MRPRPRLSEVIRTAVASDPRLSEAVNLPKVLHGRAERMEKCFSIRDDVEVVPTKLADGKYCSRGGGM